jgi:hypothetical protein
MPETPRRTALGAVVVAMAFAAPVRAQDAAALYVIPTTSEWNEPVPAGAPLRVRLKAANVPAVALALQVPPPAAGDSLVYVVDRYPQLPEAAGRTWLESTFVVDFNEPVVEPLRKDLDALGGKTTRAQLVRHVSGLLAKTDSRGWDFASVVARRREGDCSEHAVLTAAMARMRGMPARVVVGIALLSEGKSYGAFGHAWAEIREDGKWIVADAALAGTPAAARYLPMGALNDEGMGFAMDLGRLMQSWVDGVTVLGPAN